VYTGYYSVAYDRNHRHLWPAGGILLQLANHLGDSHISSKLPFLRPNIHEPADDLRLLQDR
jgi:hypothetical protein